MNHAWLMFTVTLILSLTIPCRLACADWLPFGTGANNKVHCTLWVEEPASLAGLYVGGSFTWVDGKSRKYIARWDGQAWRAVGAGLNGPVNAMAFYKNHLYVGGSFTQAGSISARYIARWNGIRWKAVGQFVDGPVHALTRHSTNLIVGGEFSAAGSVQAANIAKWNGSSWSPLGLGVNGPVYAVASVGSKLYVGGTFTQAGGASANRIARWANNNWKPLKQFGHTADGVNNAVRALAVDGSTLYIGGSFTTAGDIEAKRIVTWNGSQWMNAGLGVSGPVCAIVVESPGAVIVAGGFTRVEGLPAKRVARFDGEWEILPGLSGTILAMTYFDGQLVAAGAFTRSGGRIVNRVAIQTG